MDQMKRFYEQKINKLCIELSSRNLNSGGPSLLSKGMDTDRSAATTMDCMAVQSQEEPSTDDN